MSRSGQAFWPSLGTDDCKSVPAEKKKCQDP